MDKKVDFYPPRLTRESTTERGHWVVIDPQDSFVFEKREYCRVKVFKTGAGKASIRRYEYDSVDTQGLTRKELLKGYKDKGFKELPTIRVKRGVFHIQYKKKPPVCLKDGKMYAPVEGSRAGRHYMERRVAKQLEKVYSTLRFLNRLKGSSFTTHNRILREGWDLWDDRTEEQREEDEKWEKMTPQEITEWTNRQIEEVEREERERSNIYIDDALLKKTRDTDDRTGKKNDNTPVTDTSSNG